MVKLENDWLFCNHDHNLKMVVASAAPNPPEEEILQAARDVLEADKTMRVLRPVTEQWSIEQLNEYEDLIVTGDKIRHLDYDGLS